MYSDPIVEYFSLVHFKNSPEYLTKGDKVSVILLFSKRSNSILIEPFYSFFYLSFFTFQNKHGTFFKAKFHSNLLTVYSIVWIWISIFSLFFLLQFDVHFVDL